MKKVFACLPVLFFCFICLGSLHAQMRYGLKAGVVLADMPFREPDILVYNLVFLQKAAMPTLTFFAGGVAEYDLQRNWTLSAELQFSGKGYRESTTDSTLDFTGYNAQLWHLQAPLAINFRWNGIFVGAGPYAGIGLAGRTKTTLEIQGNPAPLIFKERVRFGNTEDDYFRRFDGGLYAQAGYSFRNFRLCVAAFFGLTNTIPDFYASAAQAKARHQSFSVGAAYYFGVGE